MGERGPYAITDDVVGSKDKSPASFCDSKCSCILDTRRLLPVLFYCVLVYFETQR
jgi:hypothetical protein